MNVLVYTGKLEGTIDVRKNAKGEESRVFKGKIGDMPRWLFGRTAEAAEALLGQNVIVNGVVNGRASDKGNYFVEPAIFGIAPAGSVQQNVVAFDGVIESVRRIRDGLYSADVGIEATVWENGKRQRVTQYVPVASSNLTESDIGKAVSVVGRFNVRQGKFIDIDADVFTVEGGLDEADVEDLMGELA